MIDYESLMSQSGSTKAECTFRVYPENLDFTIDDVFKYQIDDDTEIEVLLG